MAQPKPFACPYCENGWLYNRKFQRDFDKTIPCPACHGGNGEHFSNLVKTELPIRLNPESFAPVKRIRVEFDYEFEAQQDGHILEGEKREMVLALELAKLILKKGP